MFDEVYILGSCSKYIRCTWRLTYDVYTYVKQIKINEVIKYNTLIFRFRNGVFISTALLLSYHGYKLSKRDLRIG